MTLHKVEVHLRAYVGGNEVAINHQVYYIRAISRDAARKIVPELYKESFVWNTVIDSCERISVIKA